MVDQPEPRDADLIALFVSRDGSRLVVKVDGGSSYEVFNIAWGYDMGDDHAHVTSNISPDVDGFPIDVFSTESVIEILDGETGARLYARDL